MDATLAIYAPDLSAESVDNIARQLVADLNRETDLEARRVESAAAEGSRGDPVTIGVLALTFFSSGAAVAALKVLQTWFTRHDSVKVEFHRPDGESLLIQADNLNPEQMQQTTELARSFFKV